MRWVLLFAVLYFSPLQSQSDIRYEDYVYLPHIKSVKFHHQGLITSEPIVDLNSSGRLILSFDDILGGDITYSYKVVHCDKDWNPSDIDEMEYIDGFNDEEINDWYYSNGTKLDYTHYKLALPNNNIDWLVSGNYLIIVRDEEENEIALTRRFMVVEPMVNIFSEVRRPIVANKIKSHQQIQLDINHKNFDIVNPQREIYVSILQNGRWDNAIKDIQPKFTTGYDMKFDLTNQLVFPAGKEFRYADLRSIRYPGYGVNSVDVHSDYIDLILELDKSRFFRNYFDYDDLNGDFVIETKDYSDHDIQSEYIDVHYTLQDKNPSLDDEVYVVGKFTDWQCLQEYKLDYSLKHQSYLGTALMKQGYYDYQYVIKKSNKNIDYESYEGNMYQTTNDYIILVYYRAFSERYDRLIGTQVISSQF